MQTEYLNMANTDIGTIASSDVRTIRHPRQTARTATLTPSFDGVYTRIVCTVRIDGQRWPESSASYRCLPDVIDWLEARGYFNT